MPRRYGERLLVWGGSIDEAAIEQAQRTARLPIVAGHVALMPDAHVGIGATIGSVIPTEGAVIPSAVGVDIGCGMTAVRTDIDGSALPPDLTPLLRALERAVPAGMGRRHERASEPARAWLEANPPPHALTDAQTEKVLSQFGTLGSGNHFFEVALDEQRRVWLVLHSGSRGIGNELAAAHIARAKALARESQQPVEDLDLAYLVEGTPAFDAYIADMEWAQRYAAANRAQMMDAALRALRAVLGSAAERERIDCHHNFAQREEHDGRTLWITRKGAIRAGLGDLGIVPGSMGAATFIVRGRGEPRSYASSAHGAGRRLSRKQARKQVTPAELRESMGARVWNVERAHLLLDEGPHAYKDVVEVMQAQRDLVEVVHELHAIVNHKGT